VGLENIPAARFCDGESECEREGRQRAKREGGGRCGARKRKGASTRTESLLFAFGFSHTWALVGFPFERFPWLGGRKRDMGFAIT